MEENKLVLIPENMTAQNVFIETYKDVKIKITSKTNNKGKLSVDELNNHLHSLINVGAVSIFACSGVTQDSLLLYTQSEETYVLINDNSKFINYRIQWENSIYYKLGAKKLYNVDIDMSTHKINIPEGYKVFTIYVNNTRLKHNQYVEESNNSIKIINSGLKELELINNNIDIVIYKTNQDVPTGTEIVLTYLGVDKFFDKKTFIDETYFSERNIHPLINYESFQYQEENNVKYYGTNKRKDSITTDSVCKISIEYFVGKGFPYLYRELKNKKFRIIVNHLAAQRLDIYINCEVVNGTTKTYAKEVNKENVEIQTDGLYSISYEDIQKLVFVMKPYSSGKYNDGVYGG